MKLAAISDLHGNLPAIPKCDALLIAGDICPLADHSHWAQSQFLTHDFAKWREELDVKSVIYIAGNHDWIFERDRIGAQRWKERLQADRAPRESCYLQDDYCVLNDLKIYGTPWQPRFFDWAFNLDEPELALKFAEIPADTDILICHGPPLGYGDRSSHSNRPCGSPSLLAAIDRVKPRLCVFGHIHEGRGQWERNGTILANVTHVDRAYRPVYEAMVFDV